MIERAVGYCVCRLALVWERDTECRIRHKEADDEYSRDLLFNIGLIVKLVLSNRVTTRKANRMAMYTNYWRPYGNCNWQLVFRGVNGFSGLGDPIPQLSILMSADWTFSSRLGGFCYPTAADKDEFG